MHTEKESKARARVEPLHRTLDLSRLPVRRGDTETRAAAIFFILFGGAFLVLSVFVDWGDWSAWVSSPLLWVGAAFVALGGITLRWRRDIILDRGEIHVRDVRPWGSRAWTEAWSAYEGVRLQSAWHSTGKGGAYRVYSVELQHPDRRRKVVLYRSRREAGWREAWREASRRMNLPALEMTSDGVQAQAPEDMDTSVTEKARKGRLAADFDLSAQPPPAGLAVRVRDGMLEVRMVRKKISIVFLLLGLVLAGAGFIAGSGAGLGELGTLLLVLGAGGGMVIILASAWKLLGERQLHIGRQQVILSMRTPWGERGVESVPAEDITAITISQEAADSLSRPVLCLQTRGRTVRTGAGLSKPALEWLRDCLLASLARM